MPPSESASSFAREFPSLARALDAQFQVERELGRGGMGVVYLAREIRLDRLVALKVLPAALASEPATLERFLREARTAALLAHPNVVPVYRADEVNGNAFFAMGYVEGESLGERVRDRGPLPPSDAVPILRAVAWALAYAHARGVIHRDVKPENILLERATGRTLVSDFGIARHTTITEDAARLTQDGHVLGTVHYMSPEQVSDEPLDGRSDLYALGVVAFHALSGRLPFEGLSPSAVLVAHATRPAPSLLSVAPNVPARLSMVIDRCLAKRPEDRFATGEAFADALDDALTEAAGVLRGAGPAFSAGLPERMDAAQAEAVWKRAAQLQADALHRLEMREGLRPLTGNAERAAGEGGSVTDGYRLVDVADAAAEAGISRQYVAMALAELPRGTQPASASAIMGVSERQATSFLGTEVRSIGVSVTIPDAPARTLRALGAVLQLAPYSLQLRETVGPHPLDGGVIVFDLPGPIVGAGGAAAQAVNFYWMGTHQQLEARQVQVTLRGLPGEPGVRDRTEVTMVADLRPGVRRNVRTSQWSAGVLGTGSGAATAAILAKGAAVVASVAVLAPALAVAAGVAAVTLFGYRRLYPSVLAKAEGEMRRALGAVVAALQSETVFGLPDRVRGPGTPAIGGSLGDPGSSASNHLGDD